mgnify:CR=1 FL=1
MFLFTMIGFEVLNNITVYHTVENAEISDIEDVTEKYKSEREGESSEESRHAPELTLHDLCRFASMREFVKVTTIVACDLNYQLLEQKVVSPPPEFSFS